MALSGIFPRVYTRTAEGGGTVIAPISQRTSIRKLPSEGFTSLQALYGAGYEKQGFGWTPVDLLPVATNLALGLVPGGQVVGGMLGVTGGSPGMSNGSWDPWVGMYGVGVGPCGEGMKCLGASVGGICAGTCVPDPTVGPWTEIPYPPYEPYGPPGPPIGPTYPPTYTGNGRTMANGVQICCPSGYHPNRSAYFTRGIRDGGGPRWVQKGTVCVRNRRMNPLNPKALSKAGGRLYAGKQVNKWLNKVQVPKRRH